MERKIDDIGRILIPAEIRRKLRWEPGDKVEIEVGNENGLLLRKVKVRVPCKICGTDLFDSTSMFLGVCPQCAKKLIEDVLE